MLILKKRWILSALVCLALLIGSPLLLAEYADARQTAAGAVTSWGLSFRDEGQTPIGNADAAYLKQFDAYYVGQTSTENGKTLYLTFDAGFENGNTAPILDALKKHNAKATFFLVKNYLDTAPELVKRMVAEGHTVGNHTASHHDMSKIADRAAFEQELTLLEDAYCTLIGKDMEKLYRPPQGNFSESNLKMAQEMGYRTFFWSLAYVDWYVDRQPTREQALDKLTKRVHPGAIVLLHSTSATNAQVLDELLTKWESMGYRFAPLTTIDALEPA